MSGELFLPPGTDKVPALLIHHGSGGVSETRELRYAREIVQMGVATLVINSFKPRGITSTVRDQSTVTNNDMLADEFAALKALAGHARIDGKRVGVMGFSKGGTAALLAAHEVRAARALPEGLRFALHVPFYPIVHHAALQAEVDRRADLHAARWCRYLRRRHACARSTPQR